MEACILLIPALERTDLTHSPGQAEFEAVFNSVLGGGNDDAAEFISDL